jgi:hypothetical protein
MNLIETPTAEAWVMPPGNLLITTVTEAGATAITLTCTVPGVVDRPGAALIEMVRALALAKEHLVAVERKGR